jgi:hypothetical protein
VIAFTRLARTYDIVALSVLHASTDGVPAQRVAVGLASDVNGIVSDVVVFIGAENFSGDANDLPSMTRPIDLYFVEENFTVLNVAQHRCGEGCFVGSTGNITLIAGGFDGSRGLVNDAFTIFLCVCKFEVVRVFGHVCVAGMMIRARQSPMRAAAV